MNKYGETKKCMNQHFILTQEKKCSLLAECLHKYQWTCQYVAVWWHSTSKYLLCNWIIPEFMYRLIFAIKLHDWFNPSLPELVVDTCMFCSSNFVNGILWCVHSNKSSLEALFHGFICFSIFCKLNEIRGAFWIQKIIFGNLRTLFKNYSLEVNSEFNI